MTYEEAVIFARKLNNYQKIFILRNYWPQSDLIENLCKNPQNVSEYFLAHGIIAYKIKEDDIN